MANEQTADYGPLKYLIGTWKGSKGIDLAPEPTGEETSKYYETIIFEKAGDVTNAEAQTLAIVRYHLTVQQTLNNEVFHDQVGYWLWDKEKQTIMHSFTIPRAVSILAGGKFEAQNNDNNITFNVAAKQGEDWGILQSPFMSRNAKTIEFTQKLTINEQELSYTQTTVLVIYGRTFNHTDNNTLKKM